MTSQDPKRVIGNRVHARARHVVGEKVARNRYGRLWKQKFVSGTVEGVLTSKVTVREQVAVDVTWDIGGETKRVVVKVIIVRAEDAHCPNVPSLEGICRMQGHENAAPGEEDADRRQEGSLTVSPPSTFETAPSLGDSDLVDVHGYKWSREDVLTPIGGPIRRRQWVLRVPGGRDITTNGDFLNPRPIIEYFLAVPPIRHLKVIVELTNDNLLQAKQKLTRPSEILKFFGIMILMTRFKFGKREGLWSSTRKSKYVPAADFGTTGMPRATFRELRTAIRFGEQGEDTEMSSSQHRRRLVRGFVDAINFHRSESFDPSHTICVDESISRWYKIGGSWIEMGLPHYVAVDRRPESGCELQNSACGVSGVMLRLKSCISVDDELDTVGNETDMLHRTRVLTELISPWAGSDRVVCADSYFASVQAAEQLESMGLKFIGVVKIATRKFPMQTLGAIEMSSKGERHTYVYKGGGGQVRMMAMVWLDRERRY